MELLVDPEESNLEESNTVVPVVATRKPVLERPTEEVGSFHKDFSIFDVSKINFVHSALSDLQCPDFLFSG